MKTDKEKHSKEELMTTGQAARFFKLTKQTLLKAIELEDLKAYRLNARTIRLKQSDIDKWLEKRATTRKVSPTPQRVND